MKYNVGVSIELKGKGYFEIEVEAESESEAMMLAESSDFTKEFNSLNLQYYTTSKNIEEG